MGTYNFRNLNQAKNAGSGIAEFLLVAPVAWFTKDGIAAPAAPFNLPGDEITIKTAHTFKTPDVPNVNASGTATLTTQALTGITIVNGGTGYKVAPAITITGGGGTGAAATAIITGGRVTGVTITNAGSGYTAAPTVAFAAPPVAAYGFVRFQLTPQKNKLDFKTAGDLGLNKMNQELEAFLGGSYAELHETVKNLLNTPCIVLVKDSNCDADMYYQLGCDCQYAWITGDFGTGTTKDGAKGYTIKAMYDGSPLIYKVQDGPLLLDL